MSELIPNPVNGFKLIQSLRDSGYSLLHAICDLIDNCFDAAATEIRIQISLNNSFLEILIADNGKGMDYQTLDQALRLGSDTSHEEFDLGKYGMGLTTASISVAKRLTVITKEKGGPLLSSSQDLEVIEEKGELVKTLGNATPQTRELFSEHLPSSSSGTIVLLDKIDRFFYSNVNEIEQVLLSELGQIYNKFLLVHRRIYVNHKEVVAYDPLQLQAGSTVVAELNEFLKVKGEQVPLSIKLAILPQLPVEHYPIDKAPSLETQGFYLYRNGRQIEAPLNLGLFLRHKVFNAFRAEIQFTSESDHLFGITYTKSKTELSPDLLAALNKKLSPHINQIRSTLEHRSNLGSNSQLEALVKIAKEVFDHSDLEVQLLLEDLGKEYPFYTYRTESSLIFLTINSGHAFFDLSTSGLFDPAYATFMIVISLIQADLKAIDHPIKARRPSPLQLEDRRLFISESLSQLSDSLLE